MEALASATIVPARWLGAERDWGSIAPGCVADSVLLDADPLRDIRNTTRISVVLIGGRVLERPALDASIDEARRLLNL